MPLGFEETSIPVIFINEGWYFWDKEKEEKKPISATQALNCYIEDIDVYEKTFKEKPTPKLTVTVNAGDMYKISSGLHTWFSRCLLATLKNLSDFDLSSQLKIGIKMGEEKVVFPRIFKASGEMAKYEETFDIKKELSSEADILIAIQEIKDRIKAIKEQAQLANEKVNDEDTPF